MAFIYKGEPTTCTLNVRVGSSTQIYIQRKIPRNSKMNLCFLLSRQADANDKNLDQNKTVILKCHHFSEKILRN